MVGDACTLVHNAPNTFLKGKKMNVSTLCIAFDENYLFATQLAQSLGVSLHIPTVIIFSDGEMELSLWQEFLWERQHAIIIAPTVRTIHDDLMKVFFLARMLKQRGVKKCTWVAPYCGYSRQCRDSSGSYRGHMAAVAALVEAVGIDELIIVESHDDMIASLFSIPVHNVYVCEDIVREIQTKNIQLNDACVVAPDKGAEARASIIAQQLGLPLVVFSKQRLGPDNPSVCGIQGYTGFKRAIIIDDILDTGRTALLVAQSLRDLGVEEIHGFFVHGVFSRGIDAVMSGRLYDSMSCSNTVPFCVDISSDTLSMFTVFHAVKEIVARMQQQNI